MFLTAPLGTGMRIRTRPIATLLLVAAQLGIAAWTLPATSRLRAERSAAESAMHERDTVEPRRESRLSQFRRAALGARVEALSATDPIERWGLRPGAPPWRAVTALFLHADVLHLCVNLIGIAILGACVEQVWGPVWMSIVALGGGSLALWIDAQSGPPGTLLGASAAAAVLLGAYVVLFRSQPIRFGYLYFDYLAPRRGRFNVPCLVVAAIWMVQQIVGLVLAARGTESGIAYLSHIAGFAFGALAVLFVPRRALLDAAQKQPS